MSRGHTASSARAAAIMVALSVVQSTACTPRGDEPSRTATADPPAVVPPGVRTGAGEPPANPAPAPGKSGERTDSALGRVVVVGPDPVSWVALAEYGGTQLRLGGDAAGPLRGIAGVEVVVRGARGDREFRVDRFTVRRANGEPVDDGVIVVRGDTVILALESGREREVRDAPPALRERAGWRVWVTPTVAGVTPTYGLIAHP